MVELWKDIKNYEGLYQVSNMGRIKSLKRIIKYKNGRNQVYNSKILKPLSYKDKYLKIVLYKNKIGKTFAIHRLVAQAFIPNPYNYPVINHKDENKHNNKVDNLEWCTVKYNNNYKNVRGRAVKTRKKNLIKNKKIYVYNLQGKKVKEFNTIIQACDWLGKPNAKTHISECLNNKRKTAYNYKWEFKNNT